MTSVRAKILDVPSITASTGWRLLITASVGAAAARETRAVHIEHVTWLLPGFEARQSAVCPGAALHEGGAA